MGRVEVAILITASTSSLVGMLGGVLEDVEVGAVAVEVGAVLGLPKEVEREEGEGD